MRNLRPADLVPTYFWNHEYRHYMRGASEVKQNKILRLFVANGLELDGESKLHLNIIQLITGLK